MNTVLTADLGGTKCRFARLAEDLSLQGELVVPTPRERGAFLDLLSTTFRGLRDAALPENGAPPAAIGIGTAGVVTADGRQIAYAPNLPIDDGLPLAGLIEAAVGLPTTLINDGRASAWGEYHHGRAAGADPLLVLFFGTGIGIGLVTGGRPYAGAHNAAGEVGHTLHIPGGRLCPCGRRGCFEAYCGGGPMGERAAQSLGPRPTNLDNLANPTNLDKKAWSVGDIVDHAARDSRAQAILDEAEVAAVAMVSSLCTLLDPAAVVLGGGVLAGWPALRDRIEAGVRARCAAIVTEGLRFVESDGGSDVILWGAAAATRAAFPTGA